jgi:hypothetical protein
MATNAAFQILLYQAMGSDMKMMKDLFILVCAIAKFRREKQRFDVAKKHHLQSGCYDPHDKSAD